VKPHGKPLGVTIKVAVAGEDRPLPARGTGANQKIDRGPGHACATTSIVGVRRCLVVFRRQGLILEGPQVFPQSGELSLLPNPRKDFLPDGS
jgi:hypothetical protein